MVDLCDADGKRQLSRRDGGLRSAVRDDVPGGDDYGDLHGYGHGREYGDVHVPGDGVQPVCAGQLESRKRCAG